jgi:hypothetical protein
MGLPRVRGGFGHWAGVAASVTPARLMLCGGIERVLSASGPNFVSAASRGAFSFGDQKIAAPSKGSFVNPHHAPFSRDTLLGAAFF